MSYFPLDHESKRAIGALLEEILRFATKDPEDPERMEKLFTMLEDLAMRIRAERVHSWLRKTGP